MNRPLAIGLLLMLLTGVLVAAAMLQTSPGRKAAAATRRKIVPGDEASKDPAFLVFRNELEAVVKAKDEKALFARFVEPSLAASLREEGLESFWREIADILRLGVARKPDGSFEGPSFISKLPRDVLNEGHGSYYLVIVDSNVAVHEKPDPKSKVLETLSYDIVRKQRLDSSVTKPDAQGYVWRAIRTSLGQSGYVYSRFARDPCDPMATFGPYQPKQPWILMSFGDPCD